MPGVSEDNHDRLLAYARELELRLDLIHERCQRNDKWIHLLKSMPAVVKWYRATVRDVSRMSDRKRTRVGSQGAL